ncbi:D-glutamate cyclase family protein, partial [Clostridium botulinum]|uniref:D-glutamate cyclase family protein n=3 Tax=Bacteria TaxID=2 RepID=UPI001C9BB279
MTVFAAVQRSQGEPGLASVEARRACRGGMASATTAGLANGFVQGNLAILPEKLAGAFHRFCQLNPKPCPIIGMSDVGDFRIPALGLDLDIRTDVPRYRVWRDGEVVDEPTDITKYWRDDLVTFVLGCSYSFEEALLDDGLPIRHIERNLRVPMYRTN